MKNTSWQIYFWAIFKYIAAKEFIHQKGINLFLTGLVQVFFVAANTYLIANVFYLGVAICGFIISWIWSYNIKRVAFGSIRDRLMYCAGASSGSVLGVWVSQLIH